MTKVNFKIEGLSIKQLFLFQRTSEKLAEAYIAAMQDTINADKAIATKILPATTFL